jgi:hypothetical protein
VLCDLRAFAQTCGESNRALSHEIDPPQLPQSSLIDHHHLGKTAMDVEPNDSRVLLLYPRFVEEHEGYGSALAAQPGRSRGGQLLTRSSQPMVRPTCPPSVLQAPPLPVAAEIAALGLASGVKRARTRHTGHQYVRV